MTLLANWPRVTSMTPSAVAFVIDINPDTTPITKSILGSDALASLLATVSANGIDVTPGSDTDADLITVGVTGAPKFWWDEAEDTFALNKPIRVDATDAFAIHVEGDLDGGGEATIRADNAGTGHATLSVHAADGGGYAQVGWGIDNADGSTLHSWHAGIANPLDDDWQLTCTGMASGDIRLFCKRDAKQLGLGGIPIADVGLTGIFSSTPALNKICLTSSTTDNAIKNFRYTINHYDVDEELACLFIAESNSTVNKLYVGGGTSVFNAMTNIYIYAAANNATTTGTKVARYDATGVTPIQSAPAAIADGDTAITAENLQARILTMASSTAPRAPTVPTGTALNAVVETGLSIDWSLINTGDQTVTITAATGHTIVGAAAVAAGTSGMFRSRISATNTAITYRLN